MPHEVKKENMTAPSENTQDIFVRMQNGDRAAFDRFFDRHTAKILVYINYNLGKRLRRKIDPADVLQNLYLKLFKNFESFCERVEKRGIHRTLIRMADHEITEAYRVHFKVGKRDARREVTAAFLKAEDGEAPDALRWVPAVGTSVSARIVRDEEYRRVMGMLQQLSAIEQFVTVARVIEGVPTQEIADRLGKSRGAVQMLVARTRDKLRDRASADAEE